ncbi:hypothetical protein SOASR030_32740 [Leminorella grimontii]|uniref:Uncharacterized protein n=1 Tax=Leminorella grimontii TaxID=82981 RepID=A0AAV5N8T7_9GAMM|nr:hypothetical protein [Leminorella grimontii]KFC98490.1 hypothetical protein GLGR_0088 [Leminorella grimontii ATCC 33999 = DSM 5078]GKX57162.1 hypothetical protein SOASR030_32740 [Leminorella grimontii]GKX60898.1 hypothetical protein SOASR031_32130 [Leminorella grimontii]VFS56097.1 Uncharacterised protein [Leminorella grimontii]
MKALKSILLLIVLAAAGAGGYWYYTHQLPTYGSEGTFEITVGLLDPKTQQAMPKTPFYLVVIKEGETDPAFKNPLFGVTDEQGRAAKIVSKTQLGANDYVLVEKVGQGEYGKYFALLGSGNTIPLPNTQYTITGCGDVPEYKGTSNRQGYTVYYSATQACNIKMSIDWRNTLDGLLK